MPRMRFCSACGEPTRTKAAGFAVFGLLCVRCSPRFRREKVLVIAAFCLCLAAAFAIARYTAPREPSYFIGTPVELDRDGFPSASGAATSRPGAAGNSSTVEPTRSSALVESICGAPTKSKRPCQRKVRGGGYCWQHRDKFGATSPLPNAR